MIPVPVNSFIAGEQNGRFEYRTLVNRSRLTIAIMVLLAYQGESPWYLKPPAWIEGGA